MSSVPGKKAPAKKAPAKKVPAKKAPAKKTTGSAPTQAASTPAPSSPASNARRKSGSLAATREPTFAEHVEGTWGEFETQSGRVSYIMTNALLGSVGPDLERRLTSMLRPVREVLGVGELNFDQLLQRDLDDHRVATDLVPYLLRARPEGPAFFPPILAILLPFDQEGPIDRFPEVSADKVEHDRGMAFSEQRYEDAFRVRRFLADEDTGEFSDIRFGVLSWNDERAKVVVLDGQHRAMALLAIDRTLRKNGWEDSGVGARYRHFYQDRIQQMRDRGDFAEVSEIRVPVTVCWFPDRVGPGRDPHVAARRLFVDVNKEARPPSRDRVSLLSDTDLRNILTRALLNSLRSSDSIPPLVAIEYDNPSDRSFKVERWSALFTLQALHEIVEKLIFARRFIERVEAPVTARAGRRSDQQLSMHAQLRVRRVFPAGQSSIDLEQLDRESFPREAIDPLKSEFMNGWGAGIIYVLGNLGPFAAHYRALDAIEAGWDTGDQATVDALARESIFEGVGMYWTLMDSNVHWKSDEFAAPSGTPEYVRAWERLREKRVEFVASRSAEYVGSSTDDDIAAVEACFDVLKTQACQIGLLLLLGTVCERSGIVGPSVRDVAIDFVDALNAGLETGPAGEAHGRRLIMSQEIEDPLNRITDMRPVRAGEFRYLWLEVLVAGLHARTAKSKYSGLSVEVAAGLRDSARRRYALQLIDERFKQRLKETRQSDEQARRDLQATVILEVVAGLESALERWYGIDAKSTRTWSKSLGVVDAGPEAESEDGGES